MRQSLTKLGGKMKGFGRTLAIGVTLPLLAAGIAGVKFFGDFEQGLKGIEKTTGITGVQLEKLGKRFDQLSTKIPVSTQEMLELAQAGGQLGISGVANLEKFTIVMAKLSRASDVAGESGAKAIARILKVTGTGIEKVDQFSAALVALGNNAAASESEIISVATRVAGQIGRFDVAAASVLGISTALKALGKQAESAGSVVGRSFDAIDQAIRGGGRQAIILSKLTGIAVRNLKKQFKVDAAAIFEKFVFGLNKVEKGGGNLIKVLGLLGLKGVRINDILGTLAKRPEVLKKNLDLATKAFRENTALQKEFEIQIKTLNSSMIVIRNTFVSLLRLIGAELAPAVEFFGKIFKRILDFLRDSPVLRTLVIVLGAVAAVMGPVLFLLGAFLLILPGLTAGALALNIALLPFTGTVLLVGAAIVALITLGVILVKNWEKIKTFFDENPFGQFIKFIFFTLNPIVLLVTAIRILIASFSGLKAVKNVIKDILPKSIREFIFGGDKKLGAARGAREGNRGIANADRRDQFTGNLDVIFKNAPEGTSARARSSGPLDLNLGFAGGIQ